MINIEDKKHCCGCSACAQACPKKCITMIPDNEGFLYPLADASLCIECGLCEIVCPERSTVSSTDSPTALAAINLDSQIRSKSTSGGIFHALAAQVLEAGGVIYGAAYDDNLSVIHTRVENKDDLSAIMGSKYAQSRIGDCFSQAKEDLKSGRPVLFSGTPCQIKGLKAFLREDYAALITVDLVCHSVPSPMVLASYVGDGARNICFRDKRMSWSKYSITRETASGSTLSIPMSEDGYMGLFLMDISTRPSCSACPAKGDNSAADITLGDFWGIDSIKPDLNDDKGTSLVIVRTPRGVSLLASLQNVKMEEVSLMEAVKYNPSISAQATPHINRAYFFHCLNTGDSFDTAFKKTTDPSISGRIKRKLFRQMNKH